MRIHVRCGNKVEPELVLDYDYPFYCEQCDENLFSFETEIIPDAIEEKNDNNKFYHRRCR